MICIQIPENPEVLNDLVFKGVLQPATELIASAKIAVNLSRKVRILISTKIISEVGTTRNNHKYNTSALERSAVLAKRPTKTDENNNFKEFAVKRCH